MTRPLAASCLLALATTLVPAAASLASPGLQEEQARQTTRPAETATDRIAELEARVRQLEGQLTDANAANRTLRDENDRLRQALRDAGQPVPETAPVSDDPTASPESLFQDLVRQYRERFADPVPDDARSRARRHAEIQAWCRDAATRQRVRTTWLVRVEELQLQAGASPQARVRVVDQATTLPVGDPVTIALSRRLAS
ncbi:MAG: hypothetical protein KDA28_08250, partial [Phycisphaerales bacterium]|nr:hypothetical protein [Phycisphaerales bacterium]